MQEWGKFRDKILIPARQLDLFIFMMKKSPYLQVLPSIAKFFDRRVGPDLNNSIVGFLGECTKYHDPHPVVSQ
jgi:hypothetical protein